MLQQLLLGSVLIQRNKTLGCTQTELSKVHTDLKLSYFENGRTLLFLNEEMKK